MSVDLLGQTIGTAPFRDIRNTRPGVAEEKAMRLLRLGHLLNKVPDSVRNGSINVTRDWASNRASAAKVAASTRSSINEIESAISRMERFW